ncbi:radical SAM protein [Spirulina sp. 06S082]|uniref:radical SAM protein n=1 Tax=Spirulina sp. 06S082 TaxID=3110248 RepID=UPI002B213E45|nr:radical SAM protein [Spirulina sp. 06S082]MEA5471188.1 radical SAM protein [Spirulina sp. 06S082]
MNSTLLSQADLTTSSKPLLIEIEPARGCNLRCQMCHVTYMKDTTPRFLDVDRINWEFVRDKDISLGSLFEPTMHPSFNKLIGRLNEQNARISFVTNAFNLSLDKLDNLYDSKLSVVHFSFDGASKEKYEYIRQRSRYENVVSNIKKFIERFKNSGTTFIVNFTVCQYNMDEIIPAIDLWESLGVDILGLIGMVSREKHEFFVENTLLPVRDEFEKALETAADYVVKNDLKISLSSPYYSKPEIREKYANHFVEPSLITSNKNIDSIETTSLYSRHGYGESPIPHKDCRSPFTIARIDYDANVYICQLIKVGNLYENTFNDLWNAEERNRTISKLIENPKQCDSCDYFKFCINANNVDYEEISNFTAERLVSDSRDVEVIAERYKGFNILETGDKFYAIPLGEGDFSLERVQNQDYSVSFTAQKQSDLDKLIEIYNFKRKVVGKLIQIYTIISSKITSLLTKK